MMGLKVTTPFPSFTETGFPKELIDDLEQFSGRKVIGNKSASGTEIIKELGEEQLKTGALIVYTSADSVLQIAANEAVIPLDELYKICAYARKITIENKTWQVGRIIARPFVGTSKDNFTRTTNRHDYALKPFAKTTLNFLQEKGYDVVAIGKINDIFDGYGVTEATRTVSNHDGMLKTTAYLDKDFTGLCFTNLVDFDALYGHRRNLPGYRMAIEEFDVDLKNFIEKMHNDDLVIVVADHGNDPIHHGTDHTREMVPFICYHPDVKPIGTIQIAHGLSEHVLRYDEFANFLVDNGFQVLGEDHYHHGESAEEPSKVGVISDYDFIDAVIKSIKLVREEFASEFTGIRCLFS